MIKKASDIKPGDELILDFNVRWVVTRLEVSSSGKTILFEIGNRKTEILRTLRKPCNAPMSVYAERSNQ